MPEPSWFRYYRRLPIWAQNIVCSAGGWKNRRERYGRTFWEALEFLEKSQWWSLQEQIDYQNELLRSVIRHAYDSVPYYREVFDERKLTPGDIRTRDDLPKLPILTKHIVRTSFNDLISRAVPRKRMVHGHTGGTTGTALQLRAERETSQWQWAVWWRHRRRFGIEVSDPFIVFAGRSVVPLANMAPPFWRRNLPMHQTYVSIHHMTQGNMPPLVDYLQTRKVAYYSGYPSGLYLLAMYLLDNGIHLRHPPRVVFTGAETVLPHHRWAIEKALDTEVADQYGAGESVGNISDCRKHLYHVDMEFGVVEFEPSEALPLQQRRIICTGLRNLSMPLIRYEIGDIATLGDQACNCGRQAPVVERIDGRIESYIITPDGRQLGRLDFLFKDTNAILEAQLVQDRLDHLVVKVVGTDAYSPADAEKLLADMREYLGNVIHIDIERVDQIPREANGKFRQIVSQVFRDRYASVSEASSTAGAGQAANPE
jgi:phenylacetate-CoA ligase